MTDKQKITEILKAYTNKNNISASSVILEEYAEELVKQGVIVPPCKVGDTVYPLYADRRFRAIIEKIEINANGLLFYWVQYDVGVDCTECWDEGLFTIDDIGKTVFLDETKYLIALKEREG